VEHGNARLMVIASSEGGPPFVHAILSQLAKNFPIPIVIYQVFKSGAIDPICNALNKTTALTVKAVDSDIVLLPGSAYVIPCGLCAAVEQSHGKLALSIDARAAEGRGTDPFVRFLISACKIYGDRLSLALVGGMGEFVEHMIPGLEAVSECGGEIIIVREPGSAPLPESGKSRGQDVAIGSLSADELVARLYSYCGPTDSVRHPI
jgi:two-component system chemotaxis response regulator CheB